MKKSINIFVAVALTALAMSCAREISAPIVEDAPTYLTFTGERPQLEDATRTAWNGSTVVWTTGDKIRVGYTLDGAWMGQSEAGTAKFYASREVSIDSENATIGTFEVPIGTNSFTDPAESGEYIFYAVSPSNALGNTTASNAPVVDILLPATQTPAASSFDKLSDLMVGKTSSMSLSGLPTSAIEIVWGRVVAHADLTFTNMAFDGAETITSVELTATDGAKLAGNVSVNVSNGEISADDAVSTIKLNGDNLTPNGSSLEVWCGILPVTLTALDVEIKTNKATYTRSISGFSKTFLKNARNTLKINMTSAAREESSSSDFVLYSGTITEGDYLIVYDNGAMKAEVASNRLKYSDVSPVGNVISTTDESIIWHIAASDDYWTIYNAAEEKFAAATGSNNQAQLLVSGADDKSLWSVSGNSTYEFSNKARTAASSNNRYLRRNTTYGFACYANSTGGELSLYKRDTRTPLDAPASVTVSLNSSVNNAIDVTFSTVTNAGSYVITATPATGTPITESVTSSPATIDDLAYSTEYTISVYAVPSNTTTYRNSAPTSATGSVTTGAAPVSTGYAKLSSVNDVTTADYVIAAKVGDNYYAMSNTFGQKNGATLVTVTNGVISTSDATNYVVTITKNNNQYSISNGSETLGYGNSTNFSTDATGNAALWTVSAGTKGSFRIANVGTNTRAICLKSNATPIVFGAYATSNVTAAQTDYYDVELFKYNGAVKTEPTTTVTPASPIALNVGSTQQLTVVTDSDGAVSYASSADGVATVSSTGLITAVSTGSATITVSTAATNAYYAGTTTITVNVSNPAGNDGSQAHPFTVAEVRAYMDASESNRGPVYIQGIVSSVYAEYDQAHGTGIFYISDDGETNSAQFEAYSVKFLANNAWVNGNTQIAVGDEVIIYGGELTIYNSSIYKTKQNSGSYLYSLNGSTAETVPTITVTDNITGIAAAGVSGATESVTFSNNSGWTASVDKDGTVVTAASISGTTITYTVSANTGDARNGSITVKLSKSGRTDAIAVITVGQLAGNGSTSETVSFTQSSSGGMNATQGAQSGTKNGVTIDITNGVATDGQIRIYKSATITVSAPTNKKITKIEFTCTASGTAKYGPGCFASATGYSYSGYVGTWTGNSSSVSLTASSNQVRTTEIKVTFE